MDEQRFYDAVARELQNGTMRAGLWTRAVAETGSESSVARALYIRLRVAEMVAQEEYEREQSRIAEADRRAEEYRRANSLAEEEEQKAEAERRTQYGKIVTKWYYGPLMVGLAIIGILLVLSIVSGILKWF